jgi:uncharacterized membrane protein YhaH (DUF805 family)
MTFTDSIRTCFQKYVVWQGRASRAEFWWFALFVFVGNMVLGAGSISMMSYGAGAGSLSGIFALGTFLPYLSVLVRRLHDTDKSGWWFWVILVPMVGWIILIVLLATDGTQGENRFAYGEAQTPYDGDDDNDDDDGGYSPTNIPSVRRD